MKEKSCEGPLLQRPDFSKPFILTTDASGYAIGGIMSQGKIGKDKPIACASRSLIDNEKKYDTYKKEALAIVYCVTYSRPYLYGRKFTLVTDHKPLVWFQNSKDPCSRVTRWKLKLSEYDFDVTYKAVRTNINADALSRNPIDIENINENDNNEGVNTSQVKLNKEDNISTEIKTGKIYLKIRIIKEIIINLNIRLMIMEMLILVILEGTNKYRQRMNFMSKIIRVKSVNVA